jgi:hypothetical protein
MLKNGWTDIVLLRNWESASEPADAGAAVAKDKSSSKPTDKPVPAPINQLQASIDNRQHIFKSFLRDHPYSFKISHRDP